MKNLKSVVTPKSKIVVPAPSPNSKIGKRIVNAKQETPASTSAGKKPAPPKASDPTAASKAVSSGINIGRTTGMRVMAFQDMTLDRNDEPKFRYTDTELAKVWRDEFPNSRAVLAGRITEEIVRGVRNLYNQGTQGHGTQGVVHTSQPYVIENGKRVQTVYTRARKTADADDEEQPASAVAKKTTAVAKPVGKIVMKKGVTKTNATSLPVPNRAKVVARKSA